MDLTICLLVALVLFTFWRCKCIISIRFITTKSSRKAYAIFTFFNTFKASSFIDPITIVSRQFVSVDVKRFFQSPTASDSGQISSFSPLKPIAIEIWSSPSNFVEFFLSKIVKKIKNERQFFGNYGKFNLLSNQVIKRID